MANTIISIKSSGVVGNTPSTLQPGELAINYADGNLYYGNSTSQVEIFSAGATTEPSGLNGEIQFNSFGSFGSSGNFSYDTANNVLVVPNILVGTINVSPSIVFASATANTANQRAVTSGTYANAAYTQANTATTNAATADQRAVTSGSYANGAFSTANTASVNATSAGSYANGAFTKANTATTNAATADQRAVTSGVYANAAFGVANTASVNATSAGSYANGAYVQANTANTNAATADQRSITSGVYANSAFGVANTASVNAISAGSYANGAFNTANTANTYFYGVNDTQNTSITTANNNALSAGSYANSAYLQANTATTNAATADQRAVTSGVYANGAFGIANTASVNATSAGSYANGAFNQANTANTNAATSDQRAVTSGAYANAAFVVANTASVNSISAGSYANGAFTFANTANTYFYGVNATQNTNITTANNNALSAGSYANGAFTKANTATTNAATADQRAVTSGAYANAAFVVANTAAINATSASSYANSAYLQANTANTNAATADQRAVTSGAYANAAFVVANTAATNALSAGSYANSAYTQANTANTNAATADQKAVSAGSYANGAFGVANTASVNATSAGSYANGAFGVANTANQRAVTSGAYANAAYTQANTATTNAATADQRAVTSGAYANAAFSTANTKYNSSGGTISGDVSITGNLNVIGATVTHSANSFVVNDPLILLANNNPGNVLDTGFVSHYVESGVTKHTGLVRDSSANTYYLFDSYTPDLQGTNTINPNEATLRITTLKSNLVSDLVLVRGYDVVNHTNNSYTQANTATTNAATADQRAVTSGAYANAAYTQANTATTNAATADQRAVTSGTYANAAFGIANTASANATSAGSYANGAFGIANTANQRAVTSGTYANAAYTQANTATTNAATADQRAVTSGVYANSAYTQANTATTNAATADQRAVTSGVYANAAFSAANNRVLRSGDAMTGALSTTGNVFAQVLYANTEFYAGIATFSATLLPNALGQFTGNSNTYIQVNQQNIDPQGTSDYVLTADVGNDTSFYVDLGITNSQYNNQFPNNSLGTSVSPLDGYLVVKGSSINQLGGNLVIGTTSTLTPTEVRVIVGGVNDQNVVSKFTQTGLQVNGVTTISSNSTTDALRITQLGTGNALRVEDSANPDATPFVVDANGKLIIGHTSDMLGVAGGEQGALQIKNQGASLLTYTNDAFMYGVVNSYKSRSTTPGSFTAVQANDELGFVFFRGDNGSSFNTAAYIGANVDGTPGTNDMPGRLVFATTADGASSPTERMRIDSAGNVGIGISPTTKLHVYGSTKVGGILVEDSNTSAAAPAIEVIGKRSDSNGTMAFSGKLLLAANRTDAAIATNGVLGTLAFGGNHTNGTLANILYSASIVGISEGAFSNATTMPTALVFYTGATGRSPDTANITVGTERMRIGNTGTISLGAAPGAESLRVTPVASAVNYLEAQGQITTGGPSLIATGSDTNVPLLLKTKGAGTFNFYTSLGTLQFLVGHTASAVNYLQVTGGATGVAPIMSVQGTDTNVNLTLTTKGAGSTTILTPTAVGGTALDKQTILNLQGSAGNTVVLRAWLNRHTTGTSWEGVGYRLGHVVDVTEMSYLDFNPVGNTQGLAIQVGGLSSPFQVKTNGGEQFRVNNTASAVNYLQVTGGATGAGVTISAQGTDSNINIALTPKGTGQVTTGSPVVISGSSTTDALRITQTGTGNALVVEDSANPDVTPFVVANDGKVVVGHTSALPAVLATAPPFQVQTNIGSSDFGGAGIFNWVAASQGAGLQLSKSRSGTIGTNGVVSSGDLIGRIQFNADDGTQFLPAASIVAFVDGTPGTNDMPGRLSFSTTADGASIPTERMRITSTGNVGIGTTTLTAHSFRLANPITGGTTAWGAYWGGTVQPTVTATAVYNQTISSTASNGGVPYNINGVRHYSASQATFSVDSTVTNQYGFTAEVSLTGATNNFGFFSNITAPTAGVQTSATISTISCSGTTATITTTVPHGYTNGQTVTITATANATALTAGALVTILTVGTTDFTLIGAASNTVGVSFTASGAGTGTGTVTLNMQGSGKTVAGSSGSVFTVTAPSATYASITVLTGAVTVATRYNFYANGTAENFFGGATTISSSSTSDALHITNTGTGNALVVEDSANPDATPFVIDSTGNVVIGNPVTFDVISNQTGTLATTKFQYATTAGNNLSTFAIGNFSTSGTTVSSGITFAKSKSGTIGTYAIVAQNDRLGILDFQGADDTSFVRAARIEAFVDGIPGTNDMPGRLVFSTTADGASSPTERMRIDSYGNIGIGITAPTEKLDVVGNIKASGTVTATAFSGRLIGPELLDDVSGLTDSVNCVFTMKLNGVPVANTYIIDSKDLQVTVDGRILRPYVEDGDFIFMSAYDSFKGFRVRDNRVIIYNAPEVGSQIDLVAQYISTTKQIRRYPLSATNIGLGD